MKTIDIESAFAAYLSEDYPVGPLSAVATAARLEVRRLLGRSIFADRRAESGTITDGMELAAELRTTNEYRELTLGGEIDDNGEAETLESRVVLTLHATGPPGTARRIKHVAEAIRLAAQGFCGVWRYYDEADEIAVEIDSVTLSSSGRLPAAVGTRSADRWQYGFRQQWTIFHAQGAVSFARPPVKPVGIGADTIGQTRIR